MIVTGCVLLGEIACNKYPVLLLLLLEGSYASTGLCVDVGNRENNVIQIDQFVPCHIYVGDVWGTRCPDSLNCF